MTPHHPCARYLIRYKQIMQWELFTEQGEKQAETLCLFLSVFPSVLSPFIYCFCLALFLLSMSELVKYHAKTWPTAVCERETDILSTHTHTMGIHSMSVKSQRHGFSKLSHRDRCPYWLSQMTQLLWGVWQHIYAANMLFHLIPEELCWV